MSWTDFERLQAERNINPEAWEAATLANPNDPLTACKLAVEEDPEAAAELLLLLTRRRRLLTTAEVADALEVSRPTVTLWCRQGLFPNAIQGAETGTGAAWMIPESDLDEFERPTMGYPKGRPRKTEPEEEGDE